MQCHAVYGNRSLTEGVQRVPPGTIVSFRKDGVTERRWFSYSNLPAGNKRVTSAGLREVETVFQNAIDRCLQLQTTGHLLPLSSGDDSRRILAALHSRGLPLNALTVRVLQQAAPGFRRPLDIGNGQGAGFQAPGRRTAVAARIRPLRSASAGH